MVDDYTAERRKTEREREKFFVCFTSSCPTTQREREREVFV